MEDNKPKALRIICPKCGIEYDASYPYCTNTPCITIGIRKKEFSPEGGILTWLKGFKYPFKGFPGNTEVGQNATVKRAVMASIRLCAKKPFVYFLPFMFVFWKKRLFRNFITWLADIYTADFEKHQLPLSQFCKSGKEIIRTGIKLCGDIENKDFRETAQKAVFCIAMIWEYDSAYRFRGQDTIPLLSKQALLENPRKEIVRVFTIGCGREGGIISEKWKLFIWAFNFTLFISPLTRRFLTSIFLEMNLGELEPDTYDRYYMSRYFDYNFFGQTYEERSKWKAEEDSTYVEEYINPAVAANVMLVPNDYFYALTSPQVQEIIQSAAKQLNEMYVSKQVFATTA